MNTYRSLPTVLNIKPVYMYISLTLQHALNLTLPSPTTTTHTHTRSCVQEKLQALQGTLEPSTVEDLITKQLVRRAHSYGLYVSDMCIHSFAIDLKRSVQVSKQTYIHACAMQSH